MNIYAYEMRAGIRFTLTWTVVLCAVLIVFLSIYPVFYDDVAAFESMLSGFPPIVMAMLSMDILLVNNVLGYVSFLFVYMLLCGGVQAMILGVTTIVKERRYKTADFLFSKPMSRFSILAAKLLAGLTQILFTNVVFCVTAIIMVNIVDPSGNYTMQDLMSVMLTMLLTQIFFLGVGFLAAVLFQSIKSVFSISLGCVFGFFIVSSVSAFAADDILKYLTPFKYFDPTEIVRYGHFNYSLLNTGIAMTLLATASGFLFAIRRDIHAAS